MSRRQLFRCCDYGSSLKESSQQRERRRNAMGETIRARVRGGILEPLEKVDLPEGKEVLVTIIGVPAQGNRDAFRRAFGSWKGTIDAEKLIRDIYEDRLISTRPEPKL